MNKLQGMLNCNAVGREAIEGLRFLASLPRADAGHEKTQPFNWIHSRLFMVDNFSTLLSINAQQIFSHG